MKYKYKVGQIFKLKAPYSSKASTFQAHIIGLTEDEGKPAYKIRWTEPNKPDDLNEWTENGITTEMILIKDAVMFDERLFEL